MTKTKHTPAPWTHEGRGAVYAPDGRPIAHVWQNQGDDDREANARLIAAAPELLEALELAHATLLGANMNRSVVGRKVKAAIAKATGGAA